MRQSIQIVLVVLMMLLLLPLGAMAQDSPSEWAKEDVQQAIDAGIIPQELQSNYTAGITRADFCLLVMQLLEVYYQQDVSEIVEGRGLSLSENPFIDTQAEAVIAANKLGIVNGMEPGKFYPKGLITREQAAVMLANTVQTVGIDTSDRQAGFTDWPLISSWAQSAVSYVAAEGIMGPAQEQQFMPKGSYTREQGYITAYRVLILLDPDYELEDHTDVLGPSPSEPEKEEEDVEIEKPVIPEIVEPTPERYNIPMYQTAQEAASDMVTIGVPVWHLSDDGEKYPRTIEVTIHQYLASSVQGIFQEIFNGGEKFPIHTIGGYSWRGSSSSEHSRGCAIDLNPNENYFISSAGEVLSGKFWLPWTNPYSILPSGDVVQAFQRWGWQWGVGRWSNGDDYMHFSYYGT